jgi:hypothetical protein
VRALKFKNLLSIFAYRPKKEGKIFAIGKGNSLCTVRNGAHFIVFGYDGNYFNSLTAWRAHNAKCLFAISKKFDVFL